MNGNTGVNPQQWVMSRNTEVLQVMGQIQTVFRQPTYQLTSLDFYHEWHETVSHQLSRFGGGLSAYFNDGDLQLPPGIDASDALVVELATNLESAIIQLLSVSMAPALYAQLRFEDPTGGSVLLRKVKEMVSKPTKRQFTEMWMEVANWAVNGVDTSDPRVRACLRRLSYIHGRDPEVNRILGGFFVKMMKNPTAETRVFEFLPGDDMSFTNVMRAVNDLKPMMPRSTANTALVASGGKKKTKGPRCYRCNEYGHLARDCPASAPNRAKAYTAQVPQAAQVAKVEKGADIDGFAWTAVNKVNSDDGAFVIDSGANVHATNDRTLLRDFHVDEGILSGVGNVPVPIKGKGTIVFAHPVTDDTITVPNVLYVPEIPQNLLSTKFFTSNGGQVMMTAEGAWVTTAKTTVMKKVGTLKDTLYRLDYMPLKKNLSVVYLTSAEMHAKLGHPSPKVMTQMGYKHGPTSTECKLCAAGKMVKTVPKVRHSPLSKYPLQLIHSDVTGPFSIQGLKGERYFLTIVDDCTRWCHVIPLIQKSETTRYLQHFIESAENFFSGKGYKCAALRTDNGGEFTSTEFENYLFKKGIQHQSTVAYESSQNGVAERFHRTIKEKVRVLLSSSGMPIRFWSEALKMAEFLVNRYPAATIGNKSPFEKWYGYKPQLSHWHPFGCACEVLIPAAKRKSALTPVTASGIFIGYATLKKAYRVYVPTLKSIFVERQVSFDHSTFPYLLNGRQEDFHESDLFHNDDWLVRVVATRDTYTDPPTIHTFSDANSTGRSDEGSFNMSPRRTVLGSPRSATVLPTQSEHDSESSVQSSMCDSDESYEYESASPSESAESYTESSSAMLEEVVTEPDEQVDLASEVETHSEPAGVPVVDQDVAPGYVTEVVDESSSSVPDEVTVRDRESVHDTSKDLGNETQVTDTSKDLEYETPVIDTSKDLGNETQVTDTSKDLEYETPVIDTSKDLGNETQVSDTSQDPGYETQVIDESDDEFVDAPSGVPNVPPDIMAAATAEHEDTMVHALLDASEGTDNPLLNTIELASEVRDLPVDLQLEVIEQESPEGIEQESSVQTGEVQRSNSHGVKPYNFLNRHEPVIWEHVFPQDLSQVRIQAVQGRRYHFPDPPADNDQELLNMLSSIESVIPQHRSFDEFARDERGLLRLQEPHRKSQRSNASTINVNGQVFLAVNAVHQAMVAEASLAIPRTFKAAIHDAAAVFWKSAIRKELDAHQENRTWSLVKLPAGRRPIGCRWVFNIKDAVSPPLYKARLVAQGFRQIQGIDYSETFSPVVRYESIRVLLALAAQFGLAIHQMDVTTAFLNGDLDEEIYMRVPDGVKAPPDMVCKLHKSLYGLKQAPLCWNNKINGVLLKMGFSRSSVEFGIYSKKVGSNVVLVALYVDDLLILANTDSLIQQVKQQLSSCFKMKDLGLVSMFLGMEVFQTASSVSLHLNHYLTSFLTEFKMADCNAVTTPLPTNCDLVPDGNVLSESDASRYRTLVGKLLFASNTVRCDLAYAASALSRFIKEPHANHMAAAKHVLRYIKGTLNLGLVYQKQSKCDLLGYSDADWAQDKTDRKSVTGYTFMMSGAAITWRSTKQKTVAQSTSEAEYMALGEAVKEALWLKQLLLQIGMRSQKAVTIYEDNQGAIALASHPSNHSRTKHIDIKHHFIRDHVQKGNCIIEGISTEEMIADMQTKSLGRIKFAKFVSMAGMKKI